MTLDAFAMPTEETSKRAECTSFAALAVVEGTSAKCFELSDAHEDGLEAAMLSTYRHLDLHGDSALPPGSMEQRGSNDQSVAESAQAIDAKNKSQLNLKRDVGGSDNKRSGGRRKGKAGKDGKQPHDPESTTAATTDKLAKETANVTSPSKKTPLSFISVARASVQASQAATASVAAQAKESGSKAGLTAPAEERDARNSASASSAASFSASSGTVTPLLVSDAATTRVFQMPTIEQRRSTGQLALVCSEVAKDSGASVDVTRSTRTGELTFVVRGNTVSVETARRRIWNKLAQRISIEVEVPEGALGALIGHKGHAISKLQDETGARITVPETFAGKVLVTGDSVAVANAREYIAALVHDFETKTTTRLSVENARVLAYALGVPFGRVRDMLEAASVSDGLFSNLQTRLVHFENEHSRIDFLLTGHCEHVQEAVGKWSESLSSIHTRMRSITVELPEFVCVLLNGQRGAALRASKIAQYTMHDSSVTVQALDTDLLPAVQALFATAEIDHCDTLKLDSPQRLALLDTLYPNFLHSISESLSVTVSSCRTKTGLSIAVNGRERASVVVAAAEIGRVVSTIDAWTLKEIPVGKDFEQFLRSMLPYRSDSGCVFAAHNTVIFASEGTLDQLCAEFEAMHCDLSSLVSRRIPLEQKHHAAFIGKGGASLRELMAPFPHVRVTLHGDEIDLKGPSSETMAAEAVFIQTAQRITEAAHFEDIVLDSDLLQAAALGPNDARLSAFALKAAKDHGLKIVRLETNAPSKRSSMQKTKGAEVLYPVIRVFGPVSKIAVFGQALNFEARRLENIAEERVTLPHGQAPLFIGRNGRTVQDFRARFGVSVDMHSSNDSACDEVVLSGPRDAVALAAANIRERFGVPRYVEHVSLSSNALMLISRSRAAEFAAQHGVKLTVRDGDVIIEAASSDAVQSAKAALEANAASETVELETRTVAVPLKSDSSLRLDGIADRLFKSLARKYADLNVSLSRVAHSPSVLSDCEDTEDHLTDIIVRGQGSLVAAAEEEVTKLISSAAEFVRELVPVKSVGRIIGAEGRTARRIEAAFDVALEVPRRTKSDSDAVPKGIYVIGRSDAVQSAIAEITRLGDL